MHDAEPRVRGDERAICAIAGPPGARRCECGVCNAATARCEKSVC